MDQTRCDDTREDARRTRQDEISLYHLWTVIVKRKMVLIALLFLSLLGAALFAFTSPKVYRLEAHMKLHLPRDVATVKELPTARDLASILGTIDTEKKARIFSKKAEEITDLKILEMKGATDKFKIVIEALNRDMLPEALDDAVKYIENMNMIKSNEEKITSELDQKIRDLKETYAKSASINKEIERRLLSSSFPSLGFNPIDVQQRVLEYKTGLHRLEQERLQYKMIQPLDDPFVSKSPVKPRKALILTLACLGSLMIGLFVAFVMEYFERAGIKARFRP